MRIPKRKSDGQNQVPFDPVITREKFAELEKKLETLKVKRPKAADEVARLAEMGDFSENYAYQAAKGRLRGINDAILKLEYQLRHAVVIEQRKDSDTVHIGSTVTVESHGKKYTYQILGSSETDPKKGIISYTSPIGKVLIGHKTGERVLVELKDKKIEYTIQKIE